ncbi:MAG TPA: DUF3467 domain-containing protein [Burkholderiales bacterium]|nr:DUF3467 domain-containing protein [Burkholderiales bacterium]
MEGTEGSQGDAADGTPRWDVAGMGSAYCNVATATATRDSVVINFGLTQRTGERASAEWRSELLHRFVLSPRTAKQLHRILGALLGEYEASRGESR